MKEEQEQMQATSSTFYLFVPCTNHPLSHCRQERGEERRGVRKEARSLKSTGQGNKDASQCILVSALCQLGFHLWRWSSTRHKNGLIFIKSNRSNNIFKNIYTQFKTCLYFLQHLLNETVNVKITQSSTALSFEPCNLILGITYRHVG